MASTKNIQLLGRGLYYLILIIVPVYLLTIGVPHSKEYSNPQGITTIVDKNSIYWGNSTGPVHWRVNKYQATEQWGTFEIIEVKYYNLAILYAVLFDSLIILTWRFTRITPSN